MLPRHVPIPGDNARPSVTLDSLLREMVDVDTIARWPEPEFVAREASSYDRGTIAADQPGWFANDDHTQFLGSETRSGRTEQIMLDADGPGAIVRFWLTAGGKKDGVLRIYLDHQPEPALIFPAFDLLSGELNPGAPLAQPHPGYTRDGGGNNLYLPIPYAKHCKVTWEEKSHGQRYYQLHYRTYAPRTPVTTFSMPQFHAAQKRIDAVNKALEAPPAFVAGKIVSLNDTLPPGAEKSLRLPKGPGAVRALELRLETASPEQIERQLRSVIVRLTFDGETTVWCPATDFFGSGVGTNVLKSWLRSVDSDGAMRCRWVMPYASSGQISLLNLGARPVNATLHATTAPWVWDERSMHFHTSWRSQSGLKTPPPGDWNFVDITARGVYAGDSLALFNAEPTWYGEGDEKIYVDGEAFPSQLGTGTEDYYAYSYAPKGVFQTPFANLVRIDEPRTQGWNVMSRTRMLDSIPFRRSLRFDLELIAWQPTTLTYAATTHWYARPGAHSNAMPDPSGAAAAIPTLADARAGWRRPGSIEGETMKIIRKSGAFSVDPQDMSPWDRLRWSGGAQLTVKAENIGDFIEWEIPAPDNQPRRIVLFLTRAPDYGTLAFRVNGTRSGAAFNGFAAGVQPAAPLRLGTFAPENGRFTLRAEVVGADPKAIGARFYFGIDGLALEQET